MRGATRSGVSENFFVLRNRITMGNNADHVSDDASVFGDSGDKESFYGFPVGGNYSDNDSDLDFSDLASDEEENKEGGEAQPKVSEEEEDPNEL